MKLSIVIVNYNVAYFLEQCLNSVFSSKMNFAIEVFVVDNNSVDNSVEMVKEKFPQVILMANKQNLGFSKANNQAIKVSTGEFVLLLNPDTLIEPDTLQLTIDFMDENPDAGGLGVMMVDGKGNFLPESKRGLPTPAAAFYKMFGFSSIFPKSKRFSAYHLGNLDKNEIHEIDVLSGAFMLMRKSVLDKVGLLDEDFFMYGEDIDLSYRIQKSGFKNYYFPKARIIHYKGESTKKDSLNYVFVFYKAMIIFARKHQSTNNARFFSLLINSAIIFKASLSLVTNFLRRFTIALVDFVLIFGGLYSFAEYWGPHFADQTNSYPQLFLFVLIPLFILIDMISIYYNGGYDRPLQIKKLLRAHLPGILLIFVLYALLPESYRFSRALVVFAAFYIPSITLMWRLIGSALKVKGLELSGNIKKRFLLIGEQNETERVLDLLEKTSLQIESIQIAKSDEDTMVKIEEIVKINKINELIFCAKDLTSARIIDMMTALQHLDVDFKIAPPESLFIIGSNSINTAGDIYLQELNSINRAENKRYKRLFDFAISFGLILFYPLTFWIQRNPISYLMNLLRILLGLKTFVGFDKIDNSDVHLPKLKKGILKPSDGLENNDLSDLEIKRINMIYAREYNISNDVMILWRGFRKLYRQY